jgi:hypothetical protein
MKWLVMYVVVTCINSSSILPNDVIVSWDSNEVDEASSDVCGSDMYLVADVVSILI